MHVSRLDGGWTPLTIAPSFQGRNLTLTIPFLACYSKLTYVNLSLLLIFVRLYYPGGTRFV
jgi:hypothetical protein